jgi:HlyD family secretion protein
VQNVVTYDTVIGVSNADLKLKPGMTANVAIVIAHRDDALKIPNAALRFRLPDSVTTNPPPRKAGRIRSRTVYLLDDTGKPKSVEIKTGISDGAYTEVLDGLKEGDKIITVAMTPQTTAQPGASNPFGGGMPRRF